jgi:hypothetical protein
VITLGLTTGAIAVLEALDPHPGRALEAAVLVVASAFATITRFVGLRYALTPNAPERPPLRTANGEGRSCISRGLSG